VELRLLEEQPALASWLAARSELREVRVEGASATFVHDGDEACEADLLREMVNAGLRVVAFGSQAKSLEDVFMQVTQGHVQ